MDPLATVRPAYGASSLADVLPGVLAALGLAGVRDPLGLADQLAGVRRVAVLLVDGLGYQQLPVAARVAPELADVVAGRLGQLRSITAASRAEFAGSGLTTAIYQGARYRPATGPDELATTMLAELADDHAPALVYGYLPELDRAGHEHGLDSRQWQAAARKVGRLVARLAAGLPGDAALVLTADHGQLEVPDEGRWDLDTDPRLAAGIEVVAGDPRVRHLHTAAGAAADVLASWQGVLGDAVWVASREQVVEQGWFGPVAPAHLARIGDVVAVCQDRSAMMASAHEPAGVTRLVAMHGSWTAAEMLVPLLVVRPGVGPGG